MHQHLAAIERAEVAGLGIAAPDDAEQLVVGRIGDRNGVGELLGRIDAVVMADRPIRIGSGRSEEHTSELQSLMRSSSAVFCLNKKTLGWHRHAYSDPVRRTCAREQDNTLPPNHNTESLPTLTEKN